MCSGCPSVRACVTERGLSPTGLLPASSSLGDWVWRFSLEVGRSSRSKETAQQEVSHEYVRHHSHNMFV